MLTKKRERLEQLIARGDISRKISLTVEKEMEHTNESPDEIISRLGLVQLGKPAPFKIFYRKTEENMGYIERMELPNHKVITFDIEAGKIDFEPLRPFISQKFEYFIDGDYQNTCILNDIDGDVFGTRAISFDRCDRNE